MLDMTTSTLPRKSIEVGVETETVGTHSDTEPSEVVQYEKESNHKKSTKG